MSEFVGQKKMFRETSKQGKFDFSRMAVLCYSGSSVNVMWVKVKTVSETGYFFFRKNFTGKQTFTKSKKLHLRRGTAFNRETC